MRTAPRASMLLAAVLTFAACDGPGDLAPPDGPDAADGSDGGQPTSGRDGGARDGGTRGDGAVPAEETSVPALASRTSGVAPLSVFFDATAPPEIVRPPEVGGRRDHADLRYEWHFGDTESGTWALDGSPRDDATGFVAAHVYERPGVYKVQLIVRGEGGVLGRYGVEIEVLDPDVVYAGERTVCVSNGRDFGGCPVGALEVADTADFTSLSPHFTGGTRVLLRGESWSAGSLTRVEIDGPFTLGAFGECTSPDARGSCANAPEIRVTGDAPALEPTGSGVRDVRIMDLRFSDAGAAPGALGGASQMTDYLLLRLRAEGFGVPFGNTHWNIRGHRRVTMMDCEAVRARTNVVYIGSAELALLGNRFADALQSHVLRVWHAAKGVIAHNEISGSSIESSTGRNALKLHGPGEDVIASTAPGGLDGRTRHVVNSDNVFGSSGPWPVTIGPQDAGKDERLSDILVERNRFLSGFGTIGERRVMISLRIAGSHVTAVNNLFSGEEAGGSYTAVAVVDGGASPAPEGVRVLHNTMFLGTPTRNPSTAIQIRGARATELRNNLVQYVSGTMLTDEGEATVDEGNLFVSEPTLIDPAGPDWLELDFRPRAGSPAEDSGASAPVWADYAGAPRPSSDGPDVGAYEVR